MSEHEKVEGSGYRENVDSTDSERPIPEFGSCGTLVRYPRARLYGVPQNVISTLLNYNRMAKGLETSALEIALRTGGLAYSDKGPYTCFVPSERAFAMLSNECTENIFSDQEKLLKVLKNHTVRGKIMYKDIKKASTIKNLADKDLKVDTAEEAGIGGAKILCPDILAGNGVIHVIDTVLRD